MSDLAVRRAEADDVEAVAALARSRPYTASWSSRELSHELDRLDSVVVVGDERGTLQGYAPARVIERDCLLLDLAAALDGAGRCRALMSALALVAERAAA